MELTLEQVLQKGVEAHKAGKVQEADRYYTAILKANPKHPDANHNMGVLAVGVGKVEAALPFFKTALETNSSIAQYWLSYIDALIKLDRMSDAKAVLDQAKSKGVEGDAFEKLKERLETTSVTSLNVQDPPSDQQQALINLYTQGQYQEALTQASQVLNQFPNSINLYNIIGAANQGLGKLDEAIEAYNKALTIKPDYAEAYNNMGVVLQEQSKLEEAIEAYNKALTIKPDYADAYYNMGISLKNQGRLERAIEAYTKAISIQPDYTEAHNNMGNALKDQGKLDEAMEAFKKALSIQPDYGEACYNMGNTLKEQGKLGEAMEAFKKTISIQPDYTEAYNNMGNTLKEQGKLDEAIQAYNKALTIKPDYAEAYNNMGNALQDQGKLEEAIEAYKKALSIQPDYTEAYNNMGNALRDQGKLEEATEVYGKAIAIKPDYAEAHRNLSSIKKYTADDKQFLQVKELYGKVDLKDDARCSLSFALAKMYEDIGELDRAFQHLSEGNALRKKLLNYSIEQDKKLFSYLKKVQPRVLKNSLKVREASTDITPIFILGMPRSGTTLVEQIISSHSEVTGAGELNYVNQFGIELAIGSKLENPEAVPEFRYRYLSELLKLSNGKHFITDKMPHNFRFIPLICATLPEAKIIHVERDTAATCWSNYKQYFVSDDLEYCYDLQDVVTYYELYRDLMMLWQASYSDRIYNLSYENLTTDQENQTRKLIHHLELIWQDACLSPHLNKRSVKTASQQQVKQKVYKGSSEAWRKYEPYLNGAFDSLKST